MSSLTERLWHSDIASSLTNEAARRIEALEGALSWIREIAEMNYEQDDKLRAQGARTLKRIADKCDELHPPKAAK